MAIFDIRDDFIVVNVPKIEAYIDMSLFDEGDSDKSSVIAAPYGDGFRLIGLFNIRIFDTTEVTDAIRNKTPIRTFVYPNFIETYPSSYKNNVTLNMHNLDDEGNEIKYKVLEYYQGDIMLDTKTKKDTLNSERYLDLITKGKIPNTIPYGELNSAWEKNFDINGIGYSVPANVREAMIAVLCRDPDDPTKPFRFKAGKDPKKYSTGYLPASMRQVTSFTNVLSSLTFEDFGTALATSINMCRSDVPQTRTPFDDIISV